MYIFCLKILELQTATRIILHCNRGLSREVLKAKILIYFINILSYYLLHVGYNARYNFIEMIS